MIQGIGYFDGKLYNFLFDDNERLPEKLWIGKISTEPMYVA